MKGVYFMKHKKLTAAFFAVIGFLVLLSLTLAFPASAKDITVSDPVIRLECAATDSVVLSWKTDDEVSCFRVYSYDEETEKYTLLYKGRNTQLTVGSLEPGTVYTFVIRSYLTTGGKTYKSSIVTLTCHTTLDPVTDIRQSETTSSSHRLTWKSVTGADGYAVYYYNAEKKKYVLIGNTAKNTCKLTKLSGAYTYTYKIKAFRSQKDGSRIDSKASAAFQAITLPAAVTSFTASSVTTNSFTLKWNAVDGCDGYRLYELDPKTQKYSTAATVSHIESLSIASKQSAQSYTYAIRSYAKINGKTYYSELSDPLTVTTKPKTPTAKIKSDLPGNGKLKIEWSKVEGADGYLIYASDRKNSGFVLKKKVSAKTLECTLTGLSTSKTTYIKVKAFVTVGGKMVYSANSKLIGAKA